MKKLSLRMRLTITTVSIIAVIALMLTLVSIYNANTLVVSTQAAVTESYHTKYGIAADAPSGMTGVYDSNETAWGQVAANDAYAYAAEPAGELSGAYPAEMAFSIFTQEFNTSSLIYMLIIIAAGGFITYFALLRALRPVTKLSEEISGISENDLDMRLSGFDAGDEINKLADSFNIMMDRLHKAFLSQKSFSTAAAHELKTPIAAIKANIDVLELDASPSNEEYALTIDVVKAQLKRMIQLVDDLFVLTMERDYDFNDDVNLYDMICDIQNDLQALASKKAIEIEVSGDHTLSVSANASMLRRAFTNVIENAVKYTDKHGHVEVFIKKALGGYKVAVSDTGPGIKEENIEKIFQPFFREDSSRSRKAGGAGLGLSISQDMVKKHGGSIRLQSTGKNGSVFVIDLPETSIKQDQP